MRNEFHFYGKQPAMVKNGGLHIPQAVKSFYEVNKDYVGIDEIVGKYKYVLVNPVEEFSRKQDLVITLEKLVLNGRTIGLKLPAEFRTHLGIGSDADVLLVGYGSNFGIWKPKDFEEYVSSVSDEEIRAVLLQAGI
ncbi:division/cell wall cluster transcriptional repressor MraZ [Candidatus Woesearchaeota archaeon]|nr:division/cell wall cluster transcriptional repressor MraZ [Candidatus Woesearchaeota archaeon]